MEESDVPGERNADSPAWEWQRRDPTGDSFKIAYKNALFINNDAVLNNLTFLIENGSQQFSFCDAVTKEGYAHGKCHPARLFRVKRSRREPMGAVCGAGARLAA